MISFSFVIFGICNNKKWSLGAVFDKSIEEIGKVISSSAPRLRRLSLSLGEQQQQLNGGLREKPSLGDWWSSIYPKININIIRVGLSFLSGL